VAPADAMFQTRDGVQIDPLSDLLPNIAGYELDFVRRNTVYEQQTGEEASFMYSYTSCNQTQQQPMVWVSIDIADSPSSIHDWEYCLASLPSSFGNDPFVIQLDLQDIQIQTNPPITARFFAYQNTNNQTQVVFYWYIFSLFNVNGSVQTKCVKTRRIMYPSSIQDISEVRGQLMSFATAISNYWVPVHLWNPIALFIGQNGLFLSLVAAAILCLLFSYFVYLRRNHVKYTSSVTQ
jgi:hypothetical protein